MEITTTTPPPPSLPPPPPMSDSPRRSSSCSSSPDFEFWRLTNPSSFPQPDLLSADELFVDGVLLPLHLLHPTKPEPEPEPDPEPEPEPACDPPLAPANPASILAAPAAPSSGSKRWKDIFRVGKPSVDEKDKETKKPKERKGAAAGSGSAEQLNINIWPFSRSRSAGSAASSGGRPRPSSARKVSSAPCSRSNSRGESSKPPAPSAGRKWAASPGRAGAGAGGGIHLGRTSPVWQVNRKAGKVAEPPAAARVGPRERRPGGVRVLNLNVNTCIGYRSQVSCRGEDKDGATAGDHTRDGGGGGPGATNGGLFGFRGLFSKKVY